MAIVGAPLNTTSVLFDLNDFEDEDMKPDVFVEELEMVTCFARAGFESLLNHAKQGLERIKKGDNSDMDLESSEARLPPTGRAEDVGTTNVAFAAYMLPFFLKRLESLNKQIVKLSAKCLKAHLGGLVSPHLMDELRRVIQMANHNARPTESRTEGEEGGQGGGTAVEGPRMADFKNVLDLSPGQPWKMPDIDPPSSAKSLDPRNTAAAANARNISWREKSQARDVFGGVEEVPVKKPPVAAFGGRSQGRKATGHVTKLTPAELALLKGDDDDDSDDDDDEASDVGGAGGGSAVGGSGNVSGTASGKSVNNRSSESGKSENEKRRGGGPSFASGLQRKSSSIDESRNVAISDAVSVQEDEWQEKKRSDDRALRVRGRIPTGHHNLMKSAMQARASLEELDEDQDDDVFQQAAANTQKNA